LATSPFFYFRLKIADCRFWITPAQPKPTISNLQTRAGNGTRTHNLLLGKEAFYQLNYTRICLNDEDYNNSFFNRQPQTNKFISLSIFLVSFENCQRGMDRVKSYYINGRELLSSPVWFVNLIKKIFPQRFWVARLTRLPVLGALAHRVFFAEDDMIYLPINRSIQVNETIHRSPDLVLPSQVVNHFIQTASYRWIMDFCLCREGNQCKDYPRTYGCIFLGEAVLKINPRFGRLATVAEALAHAGKCREAGLVHVVGRNKLDEIWLAAGPGEKLMTICNCCPCCCLWKALPDLSPQIGSKVSRLPGVNVIVSDLCLGCAACTEGICFVNAIQLVDGQAQIGPECRGCGRCVEVCPNGAIELTLDQSHPIQDVIQRLSQRVDVG
jgi:Pyruvate/2-oxoacid:ferredoxin oxidoreductase delta subunit